jgi:hypothetical protein
LRVIVRSRLPMVFLTSCSVIVDAPSTIRPVATFRIAARVIAFTSIPWW